jgi:cell wall-associated NlpC family hydrolase
MPGYIILLVVYICFASCTGSRHAQQHAPASASETHKLKSKDRERLVALASKQMGVPYKWGGNTPKGFDCSGFTCYCFGQLGVQLPRTSEDQSKSGKKIRTKKARTGDLIFFKGPNARQKKVGHVGIVVAGRRNKIKFIHAATNGIMVSSLSEDYYRKRFKTIRRIPK